MRKKSLFTFLSTALAISLSFSGSVSADAIDAFNDSWQGKALDLQRGLDNNAPIKDNNILGTHNTYNSEVYRACNFSVGCRYLDPQQKYSIKDQLRMGARFIELDVHWTAKMESLFSYPKRLLLCHGVCSLNDKYATEGFNEIKDWLNDSGNSDEVIILYIEDASDGHHSDLYNQLNDRFGAKIYASGGCSSIPDSLTKAQVLAAGKQVILWKDGGCSSNSSMANQAFTGLGNVGRIWEDATTLGSIAELFDGGIDSISASEVREGFATGANIINLDDLVMDDGRIEAAIWSWGVNEPNNANNEDCAAQTGSGRWNDANCNNNYAFACEDSSGNWAIPNATTGIWSDGDNVCSALGGTFQFSVPTNSQANQVLKAAKEAEGYDTVWLNYDDRSTEGDWAGVQLDIFVGHKNLAFRSAHNKYLVAEDNGGGDVNANRSAIGSWETFNMKLLSAGSCITHGSQVAVSSQAGYYLRAISGGGLDAKASAIGSGETFTLINHSSNSSCLVNNQVVSLQSVHNQYVVAESNGNANANRSAVGSWEKFTVKL
jgi:hypothetical protein